MIDFFVAKKKSLDLGVLIFQQQCSSSVCRQIHLTRYFSHAVCTFSYMHITLHGSRRATQTCLYARIIPSSCHPWCVVVRSLSVSSCLSLSCFSPSFTSCLPSTLYLHSAQHFLSNVNSVEGNNRCAFAQRGVLPHGDIPSSHRLWAQRQLDDFDNSETSAMIFQDESGHIDTEMRLSEKRYFHHCSFRSEKNQRTEDKHLTLMKKVCCQLSPFSHTHKNGETRTRT